MVSSLLLTDIYIIQLDVITGIDVYLAASAEVKHWSSLKTKWFCHSSTWPLQNRPATADPRMFSLFCVYECMQRIYLSVPVNLMLFGSAEQISAVIICLEKVTSQISKVITFWQKTDDLTCQHLSFVCLWESMAALLKPSVLASNVSQLYFFSPSLFLQAFYFCSVKCAQ